MPERLHPGVYVEEVPSEVKPIEGAGTSTAAFIGIAEKGPIDEAVFITNWTAFQTNFGSFIKDSDLAYAVYHFFLNGGKKCYVVRVNHGIAETASLMLQNDNGQNTLEVKAASPGTWANRLKISILPGTVDPEREFSIKVWEKQEMMEQFQDLSIVNGTDNYIEKVINKASNYIRAEDQGIPDQAIFRGNVDLTPPPDLQNIKNILLKIDEFGPFIIDCSAKAIDKSAVSRPEIIDAINNVFGKLVGGEVAFTVDEEGKQYIELRSPTTGIESQIIFTPPGTADATEDIFGVVEYSWQVITAPGSETVAEVLGAADLSGLTASPGVTYSIKVGTSAKDVDFSLADSFQKVIDAINTQHAGIAGTDGKHLILRFDKDISIPTGSLTHTLFGDKIYSIAEYGDANSPAKFESTGVDFSNIASSVDDTHRILRLKINDYPVVIIDVASEVSIGGDYSGVTLDSVISNINDQYKKQTGKKKDIAAKGPNDSLVITSPTKGVDSRIVTSYSGDKDCGKVLFGEAITNYSNNFLFVAETYKSKPARVKGKDVSTEIDFSTGARQVRFSVDNDVSKDIEFAGSLTSIQIAKAINDDEFTGPAARIEYSDNEHRLVIESPTRGTDSRIYFSIPLDPNLVHDPSLNAIDRLFDFSGLDTVITGGYTKTILPPNNRPQLTEIELPDIGKKDYPLPLSGGTHNHAGVTADDILGMSANTGITALDVKDDVNLICIPGEIGKATPKSIMEGGMAYCESRSLQDCFFIADMPKDCIKPTEAQNFVKNTLTKKSDFGAIYYPWIKVTDPIGTSENVKEIPPSGLVAGMYARIDSARGVWKAPAGTESNLSGALALSYKTTDTEHDILNPFGINCIRQFPGSGIVIWGSRTLGLKSKPEWKYIPVRRMAIFLRVSIYNGIQWAVFEPNDEELWASLRLNIGSFMMRLFRQGAFQGDTPSKAFFVKCDSETTTQADIDAGVVNVLVGFAPLKPAEFVVIKISQKAGQAA